MTDIARNVRTGEICSAAERDIREDIREDAFTCVGCTAEMRPVAVAPGEAYWVAPHFRVRGLHDDDCDGDGTPVAAPAARRHGQPRRNQPGLTPTRLRLANENAPADYRQGPRIPVPRRTRGRGARRRGRSGTTGQRGGNVAQDRAMLP